MSDQTQDVGQGGDQPQVTQQEVDRMLHAMHCVSNGHTWCRWGGAAVCSKCGATR